MDGEKMDENNTKNPKVVDIDYHERKTNIDPEKHEPIPGMDNNLQDQFPQIETGPCDALDRYHRRDQIEADEATKKAIDELHDGEDAGMSVTMKSSGQDEQSKAGMSQRSYDWGNRSQNRLQGNFVILVAILIVGMILGWVSNDIVKHIQKVNTEIQSEGTVEIVPFTEVDSTPHFITSGQRAYSETIWEFPDRNQRLLNREGTVGTWMDRALEMGLDGLAASGGRTVWRDIAIQDDPVILHLERDDLNVLLVDRVEADENVMVIWFPEPFTAFMQPIQQMEIEEDSE